MTTSTATWCPCCGYHSTCELCTKDRPRVATRCLCLGDTHSSACAFSGPCREPPLIPVMVPTGYNGRLVIGGYKAAWVDQPTNKASSTNKMLTPAHINEPSIVVVIDTETTGKNTAKDRLLQLAACEVDLTTGKIGKVFETLVHPGYEDSTTDRLVLIPWYVTKIHGIRDAMVASAKPATEVLAKFFLWCKRPLTPGGEPFIRPLIAHNASFDRDIIRGACGRGEGLPWPGLPMYCTLTMARRLLPGSHKLGDVAQTLGVKTGQAHRAGGDVTTTANVLLALLAKSGKGLIATHGEGLEL